MTLTEFLTARLDEDEAVAREAADPADGDTWWPLVGLPRLAAADVAHVQRHDPARVLAEVEAKRRIVAWFSERQMIYMPTATHGDPTDPTLYVPGPLVHKADAPVLRLLALPYADHSDYDEAWRP